MIDEQRACVDIAQQLHAVEKAVCQAKRTLIQDHIDHCVEHALDDPQGVRPGVLDEFREITRYRERGSSAHYRIVIFRSGCR
jgi:DNA-binding FrmR family transcriptional regulator